ncbi:sigma-54 dependent transcriptional regulator [Agrobacterium leguminum]|uniref:C4-dicarboxylate transport transcriptional regulatory protein DctD n=1 Tax=Agrobacterium deltaense NCPPB 1641 TaxID=1183425 RepID=A0A1S7U2B2_9HYPH|nr:MULTISPECIES: sigma-54 dependent transcriptional regulator [Agrobacterium]WFS67523.1 sigma-54 dependent transcriptional regulator [Agrobacterium leguminum]CVI60800.1 C4-dicarboxylate transport transcriptional regulatory protein (response regulator in two-component reguatory system) [Agrobacterium deltaense NCPPB 1641]
MTADGTIFLVDDDSQLRKAMVQTLELDGLPVTSFARAEQALAALNEDFDGVVITDVRMPGMTGLEFFDHVRKIDADLPVILITGHGDVPMAVDALHNGAYDFIAKPFPAERMVESARRALEKRRLVLENRALRRAAGQAEDDLPLIGQTPAMERLRTTLRHIADTDVDVLVAGETGSGKEVVATALHRWSKKRSKGNFVALNCGALPETVIESELFGHEPGAFTGAQKKRVGRIEHSSGGTLFLDEIESMPLAVQVKMLRVLEMREVSPLGSNEERPVDIRVVAAAKVDLGDPSERGTFREDLYYRLNVVTLSIPPLRERKADIPLLFSHFVTKAANRFNMAVPQISAGISRRLNDHDWPGNVRELGHFAERVVLGLETEPAEAPALRSAIPASGTLPERMDEIEARIIRETLEQSNGDVAETIAMLGIARKTFYDKLQRHGINRADYVRSGTA